MIKGDEAQLGLTGWLSNHVLQALDHSNNSILDKDSMFAMFILGVG